MADHIRSAHPKKQFECSFCDRVSQVLFKVKPSVWHFWVHLTKYIQCRLLSAAKEETGTKQASTLRRGSVRAPSAWQQLRGVEFEILISSVTQAISTQALPLCPQEMWVPRYSHSLPLLPLRPDVVLPLQARLSISRVVSGSSSALAGISYSHVINSVWCSFIIYSSNWYIFSITIVDQTEMNLASPWGYCYPWDPNLLAQYWNCKCFDGCTAYLQWVEVSWLNVQAQFLMNKVGPYYIIRFSYVQCIYCC